jgi:hypothetical protein
MGFERDYPVKIPSKQLNIKPFSTHSIKYEQVPVKPCVLFNNDFAIDP